MIYSLFDVGDSDKTSHYLGEIEIFKNSDNELMDCLMEITWGRVPWPIEYFDWPRDSMTITHVCDEVHISFKDSGELLCKLIPYDSDYGFPINLIKEPLRVYKVNIHFYESIITENLCPVCGQKALTVESFVYKCSNCDWKDIFYSLADLMKQK